MSSLLAPITLSPILDRLHDQLTGWKEIGGAADLASAEKSKAPATPAAYVLLASDQPSKSIGGSGGYRQRVLSRFGVVIAIRDYKVAKRGTAKADELRERIIQIRSALVGWRHPGATQGFATQLAAPCAVLSYKNNVIWWQETYAIEYDIST